MRPSLNSNGNYLCHPISNNHPFTHLSSECNAFVCVRCRAINGSAGTIHQPTSSYRITPYIAIRVAVLSLTISIAFNFFYQDLLKSLPATKKKKKAFAAMQSTS
jgi:hypothetical protein